MIENSIDILSRVFESKNNMATRLIKDQDGDMEMVPYFVRF